MHKQLRQEDKKVALFRRKKIQKCSEKALERERLEEPNSIFEAIKTYLVRLRGKSTSSKLGRRAKKKGGPAQEGQGESTRNLLVSKCRKSAPSEL